MDRKQKEEDKERLLSKEQSEVDKETEIENGHCLLLSWSVTFDTRGPWFKSSLGQNFAMNMFAVNFT